MKYTGAHWGSYQFADGDRDITPIAGDGAPSRIGRGWVSAVSNEAVRVMAPAVRKGWLEGDGGEARRNDTYIEVSWDKALDFAAAEVSRVREVHGSQAIYGGSYGWSSAGRMHHAQSQMRRFLNVGGGFTTSRETYSFAAAEVLFPHIFGQSIGQVIDETPQMSAVIENAQVVLAFGGISTRTAQVTAAGTSFHEVPGFLDALTMGGVQVISIAPMRGDTSGEWWAIRPGTDTALILALVHEVVASGGADESFLVRCTDGWPQARAYVMGESDGILKNATWAAEICDIPADDIRSLATQLVGKRVLVSMAWAMQRSHHGEQPLWAGVLLAACLGQIGKPGCGFAFGYGSTTPVGRPGPLIPWPSFPKGLNAVSDFIPVARVADALLHPGEVYRYNTHERVYPDLRLVWWCGGNPFHHHQDLRRLEDAWTRPETVIVNESMWTATARRADIVLPANTPLERADIMMNRRDPTLIYMSPLIETVGQSRPDFEIFSDLAARMGQEEAFTEGRDSEGWMRHIWARAGDVAQANGFNLPEWEAFKRAGRFDVPVDVTRPIAFADLVAGCTRLKTEGGGITLHSAKIAAADIPDCPGHPVWIPPAEGATLAEGEFHLNSGQPDTRLHSQNDQGAESRAAKVHGREPCTMHPDAASKLGVDPGDILRLSNPRGACLCAVAVDDAIRRDVLFLPTGAWYDPQIVDGGYLEVHGNPNALTLDIGTSDLAQGNIAHTCVVHAEIWHGTLPPLTVTGPPIIDRENSNAERMAHR